MIEIVFLGTGTPNPDPERCGSGVAIVRDEAWVLIDCGRGVTQRALQAGLDLKTVSAVFLTHHHSDHVNDLATFATTRWTAGGVGPLTVVAPGGPCSRFAERCLEAFEDQAFYSQAEPTSGPRPTIRVGAFEATDDPASVYNDFGWQVSSALVDHHPIEATVAYRIEVDERVVVVSGDTAACEGVRKLAEGAEVLVHEALLSDRVPPKLLEWNAGARSVGELADRARVEILILTHLLPTPANSDDEAAFVSEARLGGYVGTLILAKDLMRVELNGGADRPLEFPLSP